MDFVNNFVLEIILIIFKINFNLINFFGKSEKYIAGYHVSLGDIKILGPVLMAILSLILFFRTYGLYTKWLAVIIFYFSFCVSLYSESPDDERFAKIWNKPSFIPSLLNFHQNPRSFDFWLQNDII